MTCCGQLRCGGSWKGANSRPLTQVEPYNNPERFRACAKPSRSRELRINFGLQHCKRQLHHCSLAYGVDNILPKNIFVFFKVKLRNNFNKFGGSYLSHGSQPRADMD